MTLLSQLAAPVPFATLVMDPLFATDANGDSGTRTVVGVFFVLLILAIVISIGLWMSRAERA